MNFIQLFQRRQKPKVEKTLSQAVSVAPLVKECLGYTGHGRHWTFLEELGDALGQVRKIASEVLAHKKGFSSRHEDVFHVHDGRSNLKFSLLVRPGEYLSSYPYMEGGTPWPLEVKEIFPWKNQVEAQILGTCHGARIGLFDTHYFRNKDLYAEESKQTFLVNGFAYKIFGDQADDSAADESCSYFPIDLEHGGAVDEVMFSSRVEAVSSVDFWGIKIQAYTVTLAMPDGFAMRLTMFTPPSASKRVFQVGERIKGHAWLFGFAKTA